MNFASILGIQILHVDIKCLTYAKTPITFTCKLPWQQFWNESYSNTAVGKRSSISTIPIGNLTSVPKKTRQVTTEVTQLLNTMEVPTNKIDILKLFDKMNKDSDWTLKDPSVDLLV